MRNLFIVGAGGFVGSAARYYVSGLFASASLAARFPFGTLVVNVTGCLVMGVLAGWADRSQLFSPETRLFLLTGLVGGYTTFSAFAYETFSLGRGQLTGAIVNVAAQVILGMAAVVIGHRAAALIGT